MVKIKEYPLWSQFVERKDEWIGGILEDLDNDPFIKPMDEEERQGIITDIVLEPNGSESAVFLVNSTNGSCGFDVRNGGVCAGEEGWITFCGYGGHQWRIRKP